MPATRKCQWSSVAPADLGIRNTFFCLNCLLMEDLQFVPSLIRAFQMHTLLVCLVLHVKMSLWKEGFTSWSVHSFALLIASTEGS